MRGRRLRSRGSHAIVLPDHALPAGTAILEPMPQNRLAEDARRPDRCAAGRAATPAARRRGRPRGRGCCSGTRDRQPTGRWSQTGCGRSGGDQGHVLQVGVRSRGMSVSDGQAAVHSARAAASAWARTDLGHVLSPRDQKWGRWMCRLSCLVCRIPLNRSGISATACFRGCSLSLLEGRLRLGSDRGSPNHGSTLASKRVRRRSGRRPG